MRLISFCKILLLSGCFTTVCTSMNAQDKVMKKQDSPIDIDLWQNGLPNTGIWQWLTRGMTGHRFSMNRE